MTMRILIVGSFLLLLNVSTFAQAAENIDYVKKTEKYRRMRNWGIGLTATGTVLFVVGTVLMMDATVEDVFGNETSTKADTGTAATMVGGVCLGTGIPLWIIGHNNHKKYSKSSQGISVKVNASPRNHGLTFTYRF